MDNVLKISEAASIALHAIVYLADNKDHKLSNHEIASALKVSEAHLSKVLQRLSKAGMVESNRGPKGGFVLAKDPAEITLLQVYEAIEGPLPNSYCLLGSPICGGENCILGNLIKNLNREVREYMEKTRVADVTKVFSEKKEASCAS